MRFRQIYFRAFGPFTDCSVNLCDGLNILYGPNEAGKSSALRAIHCLLYGIPTQCRDAFVHPYDKLRLGARLIRRDGEDFSFFRRKARKGALRDGNDDQPLEDEALTPFLSSVDESFFLSAFGIDHERLRKGGEDIVRGGGKLGELLFAAGGVGDLRRRQQDIESEASDLFKGGAQKPRINAGLSELQRLRTEVKRLQASSEAWSRLDHELTTALEQRAALEATLRGDEIAKARLVRIKQSLPSLSQWKSVSAELSELADAVLLPADFPDKLHNALSQRTLLTDRESDAARDIAEVENALAAEVVPTGFIAEAATIEDLFQRLGSHRKAMRDRASVLAMMQGAEHAAREVLRSMGRPATLETIEEHRVADDKQARIRTLCHQHQGAVEKQRAAQSLRDRLFRNLRSEEERLSDCAAVGDPSDLSRVVSKFQSSPHLDSDLAQRKNSLESRVADADASLKRLGLWTGTLEALKAISVPTADTIDHFEEGFRRLEADDDALNKRLDELADEFSRLAQEQTELVRNGAIPTEAELLRLRNDRDRGWALVLADWQGSSPHSDDVNEFVRLHPPADSLSAAFPLSMERADATSDRLRSDAERVAASAQLETRRMALQNKGSQLQQQKEALSARRDQLLVDWESRWSPCTITPLAPREMRGWLRRYDALIETSNKLHDERKGLKALIDWADSLRSKMIAAIVGLRPDAAIADKSLNELGAMAQGLVQEMLSAALQREKISDAISRLQSELAEADDDLQRAAADMASWTSSWKECMAWIGLDASSAPEQASSVLDNLATLFQEHRNAKGFRARVDGIDADARGLAAETTALVSRLMSDLANTQLEDQITSLHARLVSARDVRKRVEALEGQLASYRQKQIAAHDEHAQRKAELDAMCIEADCSQIEELSQVCARSDRKRELQDAASALEQQLQMLSAGQTVAAFAEDAALENPDELASHIEGMEERIRQLTGERDQLLQTEQRIRDELARVDGNSEAAGRASDCEIMTAQLEEDIRRYAVSRIAAAAFRKAIDNYRSRAEGPIVARASKLFADLTRGSFAGLRTDFDADGQPVLFGTRPDGDAPVHISSMSDGACDQLYLALRIATLEHWIEKHEPLPFIIDDVLLSFDDGRAEAALVALADLSRKTQVIFFTHHDHIVKLAEAVLPKTLKAGEFLLAEQWVAAG